MYLCMDLCEGHSLKALMDERLRSRSSFSEREAAALLAAVMRCLRACHATGVLHRDVKPDNFLFARPLSPLALRPHGPAATVTVSSWTPARRPSYFAGEGLPQETRARLASPAADPRQHQARRSTDRRSTDRRSTDRRSTDRRGANTQEEEDSSEDDSSEENDGEEEEKPPPHARARKYSISARELLPSSDALEKEAAGLRLIDFGLSTLFTPGKAVPAPSHGLIAGLLAAAGLGTVDHIVGSPAYLSPEAVAAHGGPEGPHGSNSHQGSSSHHHHSYGTPADIWSAGVLFYALLFRGRPLWPAARSVSDLLRAIASEAPDFSAATVGACGASWCQAGAAENGPVALCRAMLDPNPATRISADAVLSHPWILANTA